MKPVETMINSKLSQLELGAMSKVLNQLFREAVGVDCTQCRIEYVLCLAPTWGPNSFSLSARRSHVHTALFCGLHNVS